METHLQEFIKFIRLQKNYSEHTVEAYYRDLVQFFGFLHTKSGDKSVDEEYFRTGAIGVAVSVESSGSNKAAGKKARRQGDVLFLLIERKEAGIGTTDIATRHSVFLLNSADVSGVKTVEVERITAK